MRALARFAAAAIALDIVHDVLDHVVQTDDDASAKTSGLPASWVPAMARHAGGQALAQGAALAAVELTDGRRSWMRVTLGAALIGASHAFFDRRWPVIGLLRATGSERFATARTPVHSHQIVDGGRGSVTFGGGDEPLPLHGPYLADQALHRGVTLAVAAVLAR